MTGYMLCRRQIVGLYQPIHNLGPIGVDRNEIQGNFKEL